MVQTRSGQDYADGGVLLLQGTTIDGVASPAKKPRLFAGRKRRRGSPGELCQLNLDVLFLIAAHIHPIDLLNLARTCKSLRELLMDKSSVFVWRTARRQVEGLPDCPPDLTEPEYAHLVFRPRCHGCGKHTKKVLWTMRLRYCTDCRAERLCTLYSCPEIIYRHCVLATEMFAKGKQKTFWVDKEQRDSFMHEYNQSFDKAEFLRDKESRYADIQTHALECESWQSCIDSERKRDLVLRRQERQTRIFERLTQCGYQREMTFFGYDKIRIPHKSLFSSLKPLTDGERAWMAPELLDTMNGLRLRRLEMTVYRQRRDSLALEYANYVTSPSSNTTAHDFLPDVTDLACFSHFHDVIRAPEAAQMGSKSFESAFIRLPELATEWRNKFNVELAELVKIPFQLAVESASPRRVAALSKRRRRASSQTTTDKLRLASAVFKANFSIYLYPEVVGVIKRCTDSVQGGSEGDSEDVIPLQRRFHIELLDDAPYIVRACDLDPNVATVEDMDRQDARVKCLSCANGVVRKWRNAMLHASCFHATGKRHIPTQRAGGTLASNILRNLSRCCSVCNTCGAYYAVLV